MEHQILHGLINNHPSSQLFGEYLFDEDLSQFSTTQSLEYKIPFLQMLQNAESQSQSQIQFSPFHHQIKKHTSEEEEEEHNYHYYNYQTTHMPEAENQQLESCITQDMIETKSDIFRCLENRDSEGKNGNSESRSKEKRKRKRVSRVLKNKEDVENQRMTHIAVERNRRRQMNDHLSSLRSLMPPSYVQRGDQASIIGGAINFVKELEQLLETLRAQKKAKNTNNSPSPSSPPMEVTRVLSDDACDADGARNGECRAEKRSATADVEVTVIQTHVNLKIQCGRKHGQLLKLIVALEELRFTILHLNITSFHSSHLYSFNLKIEDECKIKSADEIARSVHEIFNYINGS